MKLDEVVTWYQKKIGAYDKEPWEKTVEEKILDGFSSVTLKTAKLKTELIDVDLVRGSTFPKAKPKQSLFTVIRLSILRYLFLPLYAQWWVRQTSPKAFLLILSLYMTQMINLAIYSFNVNRLSVAARKIEDFNENDLNNSKTWINHPPRDFSEDENEVKINGIEHIVSLSDLLIPMTLSLLLSFIHSQIVATNIAQSGSKCTKRRRCSNANNPSGRQKEARLRRRKKLVKLRNQDCNESNSNQPLISQRRTIQNNNNNNNKSYCNKKDFKNPCKINNEEDIKTKSICCCTTLPSCSKNPLKVDLKPTCSNNSQLMDASVDAPAECLLRRRSVNWHSPVHKFATTAQEKQQQYQQQTSTQSRSVTTSTTATSSSGGGENPSLSSSNGNSNQASPQKTVRIDDCVQEFYEDLMLRTAEAECEEPVQRRANPQIRRVSPGGTVGEDDGFESLNGKSSSGEDINHSPFILKNQKPSRFNNNNNNNNNMVLPPKTTGGDLNNEESSNPGSYQRLLSSHNLSSDETEEEGDDGDIISSPASPLNTNNYNECTTSATEWLGITTNSEECSYSSDLDNSDNYKGHNTDDQGNDTDFTPATLLNPAGVSDRISCTVWDQREIKKAQMSVLEISSCIIENVESMPEINDYVYMGVFISLILSLIPCGCRLIEAIFDTDKSEDISYFDIPIILWEKASFSFGTILKFAFGQRQWERAVLVLGFLQRFFLTLIFFMILAVAERTFKQRFLYAKLFSHLTSSRRARKSNLPHFRLNKVRNIKTWLSVRSYLKKRGPQRSVDVIVSAAFMLTLFLLGFLSVEWLKDSVHLHSHLNLEALLWSATIGVYVLRYMTLGNKIHHKYRSVSVLITEQINLYLQIEKKPKKKEELMVSNSVLKLAADLLKELETPFKISGLSANPYLFTTIKVFILSALSGVLSEMLGFKLKLHKIKIK